VVEQEGFQRLAEVVDAMEPIDPLHRLGCPPTNTIGGHIAAIPTDRRDGRMLGEPRRDAGGRALREQVHDLMRRRIDQDRAVAMASPPGPLVNSDDL
jgi:hypothetical protein